MMARYPISSLSALLVDGDEESRPSLAAMLGSIGFGRLWEASSFGAALAHLDEPWFDLVVVDLAVVEDEGYNLITLLRAREGGSGKIIAIGGSNQESQMRVARHETSFVFARPLELQAIAAACVVEPRSPQHGGEPIGRLAVAVGH